MRKLQCPLLPVRWYFHCSFQQNITVFCPTSDFYAIPVFNDTNACMSDTVADPECFWGGPHIARELLQVYPTSGDYIGSGERHKLSSRFWSRAPATNDFYRASA